MAVNILPNPLIQNEKKYFSNIKPWTYCSHQADEGSSVIGQAFNQSDATVCNRAKNANNFFLFRLIILYCKVFSIS